MVSLREVNTQLKQIGYHFNFWMRREIIELSKVLDSEETVKQCVNGRYQGGFAVLTATNHRLILIDRKPLFLTLEVIWYDKIGQIDYNHRLLNATICISTPNKDLTFNSYNNLHLRELLLYTQEKMAESNRPNVQSAPQPQHNNWRFRGSTVPVQSTASSAIAMSDTSLRDRGTQSVQVPATRAARLVVGEADNQRPHYQAGPYRASSLPFSRRRYFANAAQEE